MTSRPRLFSWCFLVGGCVSRGFWGCRVLAGAGGMGLGVWGRIIGDRLNFYYYSSLRIK